MSQTEATDSTSRIAGGKGEEEHSEAGQQANTAPSFFDRLPDELVTAIIIQSMLHSQKLASWCLSHRLNKLAVPVFAHEVTPSDQPRFLRNLVRRRHLQPFLRQLELGVPDNELAFSYECSIISLAFNLTALSLFGFDIDQDDPIVLPLAFPQTLRDLRCLRSLKIVAELPVILEDTSFRLGPDLPQLTSLAIEGHGPANHTAVLQQLLGEPCPSLRHLTIYSCVTSSPEGLPIPWTSLHSLSISFLCSAEPDTVAAILSEGYMQLLQATAGKGAAPPLQTLTLVDRIFSELYDPEISAMTQAASVQLFETLAASGTRELDLRLSPCLAVPDVVRTLPSIEIATLSTSYTNMCRPENVAALCTVLRLFPNLCELHLHDTLFGEYKQIPFPILPATSSLNFFIAHPTLLTLLFYLRQSRVLRFEWSLGTSGRKIVWLRSKGTEDFAADTYHQ